MGVELPSVRTVSGRSPGPTVAVLGGVHGDEYEGVLAVNALARTLATDLGRGVVRLVGPAHPAAWRAAARCSPVDHGDLARSFPGRPDGRPTEQVAHALTEQAIRGCDVIIDLHAAGSSFEMPFLCGYHDAGRAAAVSRGCAEAFAAEYTWRHGGPPALGRSISIAAELGIAAIYVEGRGGRSIRAGELDQYIEGTRRVLEHLGMVVGAGPSPHRPTRVCGDGNTDAGIVAPREGFFVAERCVGDVVDEGDTIARIVDLDAVTGDVVASPTGGVVMLTRRDARVSAGDTVCIVARRDVDP